MKDGLSYVEDLNWEDIFADWAKNEENEAGWQETAKMKGWENWREWRSYSAEKLGLREREWKLYKIDEPLKTVPKLLVGPFMSWQKSVPTELVGKINFEDYLELDLERWRNHQKIHSLISNFPNDTQIIGLIEPENQQIVCIEGTHRCTAISFANRENLAINEKAEVRIVLAELERAESELLLKALNLGTQKPE